MDQTLNRVIVVSPEELTDIIEKTVRKTLKEYGIQHEEDFIKIDELCEWLQVSKPTVHRWKQD